MTEGPTLNPQSSLQMVEEEATRRIEMLVKKRVEEELERRRAEIEQEVSRRVEEAKAKMEKELILELEQRREAAREEERKREVGYRPRMRRCRCFFLRLFASPI